MNANAAFAATGELPFEVTAEVAANEYTLAAAFKTPAVGELVRGACEDYLVLFGTLRATDWIIEQLANGGMCLVPTRFAGVSPGSEQVVPAVLRLCRGGAHPPVDMTPRAAGVAVSLVVYAAMIGIYANHGFERLYNLLREHAVGLSEADAILAIVE